MSDPPIEHHAVEPDIAAELPGLAVWSVLVDAAPGPSRRGVAARLAALADRVTGATAMTLRSREVPHAYRVLFRHLGLDPDEHPTPVEAAMRRRLMEGGFPATERIADACLLAVVETGVPVWALDEDRRSGPLVLRAASAGERLGEGEFAHGVPGGRLVLADDRGPVAVLFGDVAPGRAPGRATRRVRLVTVVAPGVGELFAQEALWLAAEAAGDEDEGSPAAS